MSLHNRGIVTGKLVLQEMVLRGASGLTVLMASSRLRGEDEDGLPRRQLWLNVEFSGGDSSGPAVASSRAANVRSLYQLY